jgi:hypothetical protein
MSTQESKSEREVRWERDLRREENALTLIPLPVKLPAETYDLLPRVLPLLPRSPDESPHHVPEQDVQSFLEMWEQRLLKRDEDSVWVNLSGLECWEIIPNFATTVSDALKGRDAEMRQEGGMRASIEYWRSHVEDFKDCDDKTILDRRVHTLRSIAPLLSAVALSGAWGVTYQRSRENIYKIRGKVQDWIDKNGDQWDLDQPFGGMVHVDNESLDYRT